MQTLEIGQLSQFKCYGTDPIGSRCRKVENFSKLLRETFAARFGKSISLSQQERQVYVERIKRLSIRILELEMELSQSVGRVK